MHVVRFAQDGSSEPWANMLRYLKGLVVQRMLQTAASAESPNSCDVVQLQQSRHFGLRAHRPSSAPVLPPAVRRLHLASSDGVPAVNPTSHGLSRNGVRCRPSQSSENDVLVRGCLPPNKPGQSITPAEAASRNQQSV
ncbi:hypothetical protein CCHR01_12286 [Colletotrichum chrysophilum]|uniref:Uncharacterized protein n=1 Tax=Colletotrichum chrysophilum TaxID=1836956 RepID=A0AAD9ACG0_9PEZI|nr:hypothetical protein CCHR01_12286 [Colletotrichum chrysophilum]